MIDCTHARVLWDLHRRDAHELDAEARGDVDRHLHQCAACQTWTKQEVRVDQSLTAALRDVPVAADLSRRIQARLSRNRPYHPLRWVAAAAAVLLMIGSAGLYFWMIEPPDIAVADMASNSIGYISSRSAESVEQWFEGEGVSIVAPPDFNYDYLNPPVEFQMVKGRRGPRLNFFYPGTDKTPAAVAHVYVVNDTQFQVDQLIESIPSPSAETHHTVEVQRNANFLYVIFYTGGSLRPFETPRAVPSNVQ